MIENVFDALASLRRLREFCETRLAVGAGTADKAVLLCRDLETVLFDEAGRQRERPSPLPSEKAHVPY